MTATIDFTQPIETEFGEACTVLATDLKQPFCNAVRTEAGDLLRVDNDGENTRWPTGTDVRQAAKVSYRNVYADFIGCEYSDKTSFRHKDGDPGRLCRLKITRRGTEVSYEVEANRGPYGDPKPLDLSKPVCDPQRGGDCEVLCTDAAGDFPIHTQCVADKKARKYFADGRFYRWDDEPSLQNRPEEYVLSIEFAGSGVSTSDDEFWSRYNHPFADVRLKVLEAADGSVTCTVLK